MHMHHYCAYAHVHNIMYHACRMAALYMYYSSVHVHNNIHDLYNYKSITLQCTDISAHLIALTGSAGCFRPTTGSF